MAPNKFFFYLILFTLIIFCQGFHSVLGRYLRPDEGIQQQMHGVISMENDVSPPTPPSEVVGMPPAAPGRDVDNFRPTAPGHSPGVGHSIHD
ncbi:hypothetical protein VNO77_40842 [Canavalia gladiata]|uniref:Uncharacterized protein n=1 Tax=Canavalia gladiata TaxID=3824 RepID=A0AAN9JYS7_CANGL